MARQQRIPAPGYKGIFFVDSVSPATGKPDQVIYIRYKRDGKLYEEKVGRTSEKAPKPNHTKFWSAHLASLVRADRMRGREMTNAARREAEQAAKEAEASRWSIKKIWTEYDETHKGRACAKPDASYSNYFLPELGEKTPDEIVTLDLERLRRNLAKTKSPRTKKTLSAQTQKHVLALLKRMLRWAADMGHIPPTIHLKFKMPAVDNEKTEFMSADQLQAYLKALDEEKDQHSAAFFRIALLTGIRRTALLNVQWSDVDLEGGFLTLQGTSAKSGKTQTIPLSAGAVEVLRGIVRTDSPYVWQGKDGGPREDMRRMGRRLRDKAGLPEDFRPVHGLRHHFASHLASSGASLYEVGTLLTHGDISVTKRYAHLSDQALKRAVALADGIMAKDQADKVVEIGKK